MAIFGSKEWDFNSVSPFAQGSIPTRILSFFTQCLRESITPLQTETVIRLFLSMFFMAMIFYIVYFTLVKPKFSSKITESAISLVQTNFIDNILESTTIRPYIANLPYDVLTKLSSTPDPYYTSYNNAITTTFSIIFTFIITLLFLFVFIANNLLCIDYSFLRILGENFIISFFVSISSFVYFLYYIGKYNFVYPFNVANIFIDKLIQNAATYKQ